MSTLFEKLGGAPAVDAAVGIFYEKVLADGRIKHFFDGADLARLAEHQRRFLAYAFGGPANYTGGTMRKAHEALVARGLDDSHFDAVVENLAATLKELGVGDDLIGEVALVAESVRPDVLGQ